MRRPALLLAAAAALVSRAAAQDQGVPIMRHAAQVFQSLTGFQASFHLHTTDARAGDSDGRGTLSQSGRNLFAMWFTDPPHDALVMDGAKLWVYTPSSNPRQVLVYPMPSGPTYATNVLGWFLDNPTERYRITYLNTETIDRWPTYVVQLEPTSKDMGFRTARIWIDQDDAYPRRIDTEEADGVKRSLQLSNIRANIVIPPSTFVFKVPPGVRMIDQ